MNVRHPSWDDAASVLELLQAADRAALGDTDWIEGDLRAEWSTLDLERDAWVLEVDGAIAGYASMEFRGGGRFVADGYVHPEYEGRGAGSELLRLTETRALERVDTVSAGERVYLQNAFVERHQGDCTSQLFARHGYARVGLHQRMVIDLEREPDPAPPRSGVEIGAYRHPEDARAVHAARNEAMAGHWEYRAVPWEEWESTRFSDTRFDPSLWLVARDGEEVAGFSLNYGKTGGDWGFVGLIAVRPAWRRQGLGEALMLASFREFWSRGERRVGLSVDVHSPTGAARLYERVGMRVFYRIVVYEKELRPVEE